MIILPTQGTEAIIGFILPPAIDLINTYVPDTRVRYVISLIVCLLIGAVMNMQNLNAQDVLGSATLVFASAQTTYKLFWEKSGARKDIQNRLTGGEN